MRVNIVTLSLIFVLTLEYSYAQKFNTPLEGFSRQKPAYLEMEDGTKMEGKLNGFKRKKGLFEVVKMEDESGTDLKIDASSIKNMYLAPSDLAKMNAAFDEIYNVNNWGKQPNVDTTLMTEGYVYFEKVPTEVKKETIDLMLQLLNAHFSTEIKVYLDPRANESTGISVGGITVAGGLDKSYYVKKKDDDTAFKLTKADYKKQFEEFFGDSPEFMEKFDKPKWADFETHVYEYTLIKEAE